MTKEKIEIVVTPTIKFKDITNWAHDNSTDWYNWVPIYSDKKIQKQYKKWLKDNV